MTSPAFRCWMLLLALGQPMQVPLTDQYGRVDRLDAHLGEPAVVIVVSAPRLRKARKWEIAIRERFEALRIVRIADVPPGEPRASHEDVAARLRERVPEELSVWIDLDRVWAEGLELDTSRPNLLVIDASGVLRSTVNGRFSPAAFEELSAAVEDVLERP